MRNQLYTIEILQLKVFLLTKMGGGVAYTQGVHIMKKIALVVFFIVVFLLTSCKDKELIQKVDSMTIQIESLAEENKSLKKQIESLDEGNKSLKKQIDAIKPETESIQSQLVFKAEAYPVDYAITKQSISDFLTLVRSEIVPAIAKAEGASDAELKMALAMLDAMNDEEVLEAFGSGLGIDFEDAPVLQLLNESVLRLDGEEGSYEDKDGVLFVEGQKFGTINEDVIALVAVEDGIEVRFNFYRTTPKSDLNISLSEKLELMNSKLNEVYSYVFY